MDQFEQLQKRIASIFDQPVEELQTSKVAPPAIVVDKPLTRSLVTKGKAPILNDLTWEKIAKASDIHSIISGSDLVGNITYVNDNFIRISKYNREELIGAPHSLLRSDIHSDLFFKRMWDTIQAGNNWKGTVKNKAKDGSYYWVKTLIMPIKNAAGKVVSYISLRTEITDFIKIASQKKTLEHKTRCITNLNRVYSINRSNKSLKIILLEALRIMFEAPWLKVLEKGGVFLANPVSRELTLIASHKMGPDINRLCSKVKYGHCLCGRAAETQQPVFASCVDSRHEVRFEAMAPHGHYNLPIMVGSDLIGVMVVYLAHGSKRNVDEEGFLTEFAHALGVIISFKRREEELLTAKLKAEKSAETAHNAMVEAQAGEQAKTNFLATMSHELRTPLNGVVGMLHAVRQSPLSEEQSEDLDIAMSSADMLLGLINDVLDFSKLEYGSMSMEFRPVNMEKLVKESIAPLVIAAKEKGLQLTSSVCKEMPKHCLGDGIRLRQIASNLVSNAIKFTQSGSVELTIELCATPEGQEGALWAITKVTDTGVGMETSALGHIFEKFAQADSTITRQFGGTGLGLAICKQLVEQMGGQIGVTSEKGKGSCFWFTLPVIAVDEVGNRL